MSKRLADQGRMRKRQDAGQRNATPAWLPAFDDPTQYYDVHESIREYRKTGSTVVVLCFECMANPASTRSAGGVRCEVCDHKRTRRMTAAAKARSA